MQKKLRKKKSDELFHHLNKFLDIEIQKHTNIHIQTKYVTIVRRVYETTNTFSFFNTSEIKFRVIIKFWNKKTKKKIEIIFVSTLSFTQLSQHILEQTT